jgi:hypothetical protein
MLAEVIVGGKLGCVTTVGSDTNQGDQSGTWTATGRTNNTSKIKVIETSGTELALAEASHTIIKLSCGGEFGVVKIKAVKRAARLIIRRTLFRILGTAILRRERVSPHNHVRLL